MLAAEAARDKDCTIPEPKGKARAEGNRTLHELSITTSYEFWLGALWLLVYVDREGRCVLVDSARHVITRMLKPRLVRDG
jgi:hypothetical protein